MIAENPKVSEDLETNKNFCAGILTDEEENFYFDTRFNSFEEAYMWAIEHNCTHIYDAKKDEFAKI